MQVVNVKVANIRPRFKNLKEWMADPQNVYIGRAGVVFVDGARFPKAASPFANPFKLKDARRGRAEVVAKYRKYILERLALEPALGVLLDSLEGKTLGCWCSPGLCHGDVLVEIIEKRARERRESRAVAEEEGGGPPAAKKQCTAE